VSERLTLDLLRAMKRDGRKIAAVVCWDQATAEVADAAGVEIVSVGDSVVDSFEELVVYCGAVRRGVRRALVSCDLPEPSVEAAQHLVDVGAELVKVGGRDAVREIAAAGTPVWAQLEGGDDPVAEAKQLEAAGAALLDFRHSGREAGAAVVGAVAIPVLGGLGGGPWLDGRVRAIHRLLDEPLAAYVEDVRGGRAVQGD
jgi:3-methyl-2-oxobutanoate hydroxymethyltransferase